MFVIIILEIVILRAEESIIFLSKSHQYFGFKLYDLLRVIKLHKIYLLKSKIV